MVTLVFNALPATASGSVQNIDTGKGFTTIQAAIDDADTLDGHTIEVAPGLYVENVDVTKEPTITGAGADVTTVRAAVSTDDVFDVTANNVVISGFTIKDALGTNTAGVHLKSSHNTVSGNTITNNEYGVRLYESSDNTVSGNTITNNERGVHLSLSSATTVSGNTIANSTTYGVRLVSSSNTFYHNNFVDNALQVDIEPPGYANVWNGSYPSGGNYWSDYDGADLLSGPHQNEPGSDGIGDTPYGIDGLNQDNYPLMKPYSGPYDLGITNITTSKTVIGQGGNVTIIVQILNYGINTETFNITAYANTTLIDQVEITLPSRTSTTVTITWNTTDFAYSNYTITAVADTLLGETDTLDNTRTCWVVVTLQGDVNGDYSVDGSDLFALSKAYGSTLGRPNWNPNCDLNNDNTIDALDLFELSQNYGTTTPEVLVSTLAASASLIVALVAYVASKTRRRTRVGTRHSRAHENP